MLRPRQKSPTLPFLPALLCCVLATDTVRGQGETKQQTNPKGAEANAEPGAKQDATSTTSDSTTADSPWTKLRARLERASAEERARLTKLLDPMLADLGLDYTSEDNRDYLRREFDKIARLDPDIVAALLPLIAPKRDEDASRNRADNARRILERFDLAAYRDTIRKLVDDAASMRGRLRALRLLARTRHPERKALLDRALKNTPEVYVPELLAAVGASRDASLAPRIVPFLGRPSEAQRLAALWALASMGAHESIEACTKATVDLANETGYAALLALLERASAKPLPKDSRVAFAKALRETLLRAESLAKSDALRAVALARKLPTEGLGVAQQSLETAVLGLVEHPSTDVQFAAARLLQDRGDKRAVKKILDRLDDFVRNNKKVPYAWQQRALAHKAFGNPKYAIRDVTQAIRLAPTSDPRLHFLAAEIEVERKASTAVLRHLKAAEASPAELSRFRSQHPAIEELLQRNRQLRRLFGEQ